MLAWKKRYFRDLKKKNSSSVSGFSRETQKLSNVPFNIRWHICKWFGIVDGRFSQFHHPSVIDMAKSNGF